MRKPAATVGFIDPGSMYSAVMRGLEPGTAYTYHMGNAGAHSSYVCIVKSFSRPLHRSHPTPIHSIKQSTPPDPPLFTFTTPPAPGPAHVTTRGTGPRE